MDALRLPVSEGVVACPLRQQIDAGWCVGCRWLEEVQLEDDRVVVRCIPPGTPSTARRARNH